MKVEDEDELLDIPEENPVLSRMPEDIEEVVTGIEIEDEEDGRKDYAVVVNGELMKVRELFVSFFIPNLNTAKRLTKKYHVVLQRQALGRTLNVHETLRRRRVLTNVLCTSHLLSVSSGDFKASQISHFAAVSFIFQLDVFFKLTIALAFSFNFVVISLDFQRTPFWSWRQKKIPSVKDDFFSFGRGEVSGREGAQIFFPLKLFSSKTSYFYHLKTLIPRFDDHFRADISVKQIFL